MKKRWLPTIVIAVLIATNLVTLGLLLKWRMWDEMWLRYQVETTATYSGALQALADFRKGQFRFLRLIPVDAGTIEATGEMDGPFEVWTWTYAEGIPGSKDAGEAFISLYNRKMRRMYDNPKPFLQGVANHPLQLPSRGTGVRVERRDVE